MGWMTLFTTTDVIALFTFCGQTSSFIDICEILSDPKWVDYAVITPSAHTI